MNEANYKPLALRAKFATLALCVFAAALVLSFFIVWDLRQMAYDLVAGKYVSESQIDSVVAREESLLWLTIGSYVLCAVGFCMWIYRAAANVVALTGDTRIRPGWAVGYFFIPILNLWKPYQAIRDVWVVSGEVESIRSDGPAHYGRETGSAGLVLTWWLAWVASMLINNYANRSMNDSTTPADVAHAADITLVALGASGLALALAIAVIHALTKRIEAHAPSGLPQSRVVSDQAGTAD